MTKQFALKIIEEKCVKANPDIISHKGYKRVEGRVENVWDIRPITLADVLLAIKNKDIKLEQKLKDMGSDGCKRNYFGSFLMTWRAQDSQIGGKEFWNLKETLENQTEERILFIAELLS